MCERYALQMTAAFSTTGLESIDYGKYPNESVQKKFIRMYLEESALLKGLLVPGPIPIHQFHDVILKGASSWSHSHTPLP